MGSSQELCHRRFLMIRRGGKMKQNKQQEAVLMGIIFKLSRTNVHDIW